MKISKEETKYYKYKFEFDFCLEILEFCRWIKQEVGWKNFGYFDGSWRFNSINVITVIKNKFPIVEVDDDVVDDFSDLKEKKDKELLELEKINELKNATDSDMVIDGLKMELYPYQKVGVNFLKRNNGRAIINSDMGTGKSIQSIAYVVHEKLKKTVVICPSVVKFAWESEIIKWTDLKPFVIDSKSKLDTHVYEEYDVFIINYDILKKHLDFFLYKFDILIIDEVQKIKSQNALRSKLVKRIATNINKVVMLTGTLLLSRPVELFNPLNILDPKTWGNWLGFTKKFCNGHHGAFGYDFSGESNIEELRQKISKYYIRHTKEDVLKDLPKKVFIDTPIKLDSEKRFEYDLILSSFVEYLKDVKNKSDKEIKKSLQAEKLVQLNLLRQVTTNGKVNTAIKLIENIIVENKKVILFSSYNEPLKELKEKFGDSAVLLIGETPDFIRKANVKSFQEDPKIKIFLCNFATGSVGITLTEASNVIFLNAAWNPADMSQAYSRAHRIGNTDSHLNIYSIIAKDTIDLKINELLKDKQKIFDKLFDKNYIEDTKQKDINIISGVVENIIKEAKI